MRKWIVTIHTVHDNGEYVYDYMAEGDDPAPLVAKYEALINHKKEYVSIQEIRAFSDGGRI